MASQCRFTDVAMVSYTIDDVISVRVVSLTAARETERGTNRKRNKQKNLKRGLHFQHLFSILFVFCRPSTPVHDLLEHRYQDQWLQERRSTEMAKRQKEETKVSVGNTLCLRCVEGDYLGGSCRWHDS